MNTCWSFGKKDNGGELIHIQLFVSPWTVVLQAPLSKGFFRQEYWSGLPFPSLGDLPDPGIFPTRGSSRPRDQTNVSCVSCIGRWILYHCATWETYRVGCHFLLQGIFWIQRSNLNLLHWQVGSLTLSHQGSWQKLLWLSKYFKKC